MRTVFLDYETVSNGDLDTASLEQAAPYDLIALLGIGGPPLRCDPLKDVAQPGHGLASPGAAHFLVADAFRR